VSTARYLIGDVFDRLAEIPDGSVDLVLTSPPFLALRSYLPADHPDKGKEIGSEPTPAAFLDTLLALSAEWRRVLAPHGSICVELGDTYAGNGGTGGVDEGARRLPSTDRQALMLETHVDRDANGKYEGSRLQDRRRASTNGNRNRDNAPGWPLDKSMCGIPHLYHLSLAYGRNLLTGEPSPAGQWRIRNVIAWCRPNPPVGALGDKFRPATSYMTVATIARNRWFDLDAVRTEAQDMRPRNTNGPKSNAASAEIQTKYDTRIGSNPAGAPPLDWWEIPTEPYSGSHYATFPKALLTRPILAMCPEKVCQVCGEPSRRIVECEGVGVSGRGLATSRLLGGGRKDGTAGWERTQTTTLGWTDCGCSTDGTHWRRGHVLDPFGGSGTTAAVATGMGRDCTLIDIDARNADLARERVGMFLEVTE